MTGKAHLLPDASAPLREIVNLIRVRQWPKNGLVFFPLLLAPTAGHHAYEDSLFLFLAFSCLASIVYVINDLMDAESDRLHPTKRFRPLASGTISPIGGAWIIAALAAMLAGLATQLPTSALIMMGGYLTLNILYSVRLKQVPILEIFCVAMGFVIRVFAGAEVVDLAMSIELIVFVFFFCTFISIGKRRREFIQASENGALHRKVLDHYNLAFIDVLLTATMAMAGLFLWMHVLVIVHTIVLSKALLLCLSALCITAIMFRYLQAVFVEAGGGSPVAFLFRDTFCLVSAACSIGLYWLCMSIL